MAAKRGNAVKRLSLRRNRRMANSVRIELLPSFSLVSWRINRASACREARALLRDGREAILTAATPFHHAHHAVMLAVSAAARREICVGVGDNERRDQRPTEEHHQRDGDGAAHRVN